MICGDTKKSIVKKIVEDINKKKSNLNEAFKYIQKSKNANIKTYERIIAIKEKLVENKTNDIIFEEINSLYQKIIEVLSSLNNEEFKKYLDKLHVFMNKYDKLKCEENSKNESNKTSNKNKK